MKNLLYKDIDLNFLAHPDTGDIVTLSDRDSIKRSVKSLIRTNIYERVMHPEKASQVSGLLFENDSPHTRNMLKSAIISVLVQYEPRITVQQIDVLAENGAYKIKIKYAISNFDDVEKIEILLTRVR